MAAGEGGSGVGGEEIGLNSGADGWTFIDGRERRGVFPRFGVSAFVRFFHLCAPFILGRESRDLTRRRRRGTEFNGGIGGEDWGPHPLPSPQWGTPPLPAGRGGADAYDLSAFRCLRSVRLSLSKNRIAGAERARAEVRRRVWQQSRRRWYEGTLYAERREYLF